MCLKKHHIRNYLNIQLSHPTKSNFKCLEFMASSKSIKNYNNDDDNSDDTLPRIKKDRRDCLIEKFLDGLFSFSKERNACVTFKFFETYFLDL